MISDRKARTRDKLWVILTGGDASADLELSLRLEWSRRYLQAVYQGSPVPPPPEPDALKRTAAGG